MKPDDDYAPSAPLMSSEDYRQYGNDYRSNLKYDRARDQGQVSSVLPVARRINTADYSESFFVPPLGTVVSQTYAVRPLELVVQPTTSWKDSWAAILFIFKMAIVIMLASLSLTMWDESVHYIDSHWDATSPFVFAALLTIVAVVLVGTLWITLIVYYASTIINFMLLGGMIINLCISIISLMTGNLFPFILFGLLAMFNYCYMRSVLDRIPFASAVIATAAAAIQKNYTGIIISFLALSVSFGLFVICWASAVTFVISYFHIANNDQNRSPEESKLSAPAVLSLVGLLFSLHWTTQLIKAIIQSVVAGSVACWWFDPDRRAPVRASLTRAITTQLGSLSFASLLVAVIRTLRDVVKVVRSSLRRPDGRNSNIAESCALCIVDAILRQLDYAVTYFNSYAIIYVSVYGEEFLHAGRKVMDLFANRFVLCVFFRGGGARLLSVKIVIKNLLRYDRR